MRKFFREVDLRRYKKRFIIAGEGSVTEKQYFNMLKGNALVLIEVLPHANKSAPRYLLKTIERKLCKSKLRDGDEAWCVCDTDKWTDEQLDELHEWSKQSENYGLAVSNPNFEFWLLLHFEDGNKVKTSGDCKVRLEKHLSRNGKSIDTRKFKEEKVAIAIERAKNRDRPPCESYPKSQKQTTVYRLVEKIIAA